jgi:succinoglycan biosynthesis protein ExoO/succinoglycan biosynthesis protein ExoU
MRVSVIVAAYNAAATIDRALCSALAQTERDLEILVIDDASTDATAAIVAARGDPRIRLLAAPVNGGPGAARNLGLAAAQGEWIAILDADDRFRPGRLERLLRLADAQGAEMAADNLLLCPDGTPGAALMFPPGTLPPDGRLDTRAFVIGNTTWRGRTRRGYGYLKPLIRRAFLDNAGLRYDDARFAEDYIFFLRCLLHGARWLVSPEAGYEYAVASHSAAVAHGSDDLVHLIGQERALAAQAADPAVAAAMRRHIRSVELALAWFRFAEALKRRDPVAAGAEMFRDPATLIHVLRQGLATVPRALGRLAPR